MRGGPSARAWQRMLSGRRLDLLDPSPLDIEIEDIAHGLARVARWNGQTTGDHAFSVAQHSLIVERLVALTDPDPRARLAALLHDGPEYVIGDMISPFKVVLGGDYQSVEARLQTAIHLRFGLPASLSPTRRAAIKEADRICAFHEATHLAGFSQGEAVRIFGKPARPVELQELAPLPVGLVQAAFLERFRTLDDLVSALPGQDGASPAPRSSAKKRP